MAVEPSDGAIQGFIDISGLPRSNAIRWLKAHNNDANSAVIGWIDGGNAELPPPPKYNDSYAEQQFHTDRNGNPPQSQMEASFGTNQAGALDPSAFSDKVPPTRPSSRVSNTRLGPVYGPENNPNLPHEETFEDQIQRAKEMSLSESQTLPAQETGVTYDNPYFRPATQGHYDSAKWALTVAEAHTQEILLNPEPPDRKRSPGTPAFLKPSSSSDCLPALIKILHAIPLAREALLNRSHLLNDYGRDNDWWDGTPIRGLRVVNIDEGDRDGSLDDLIYETQRLMAFLDDTERAYGSADSLAGLSSLVRMLDSMPHSYLESWRNATQRSIEENVPLSTIFSSRGTRRAKRSDNADEYELFNCLQVRVDSSTADRGFSLYEAIDDMVWSSSFESDTFLDEFGEIFTFEVTNHLENSQSLGISVPPIWYADRYTEFALEDAARMQAEKEKVMTQVQEIDNIQALMTSFQKAGTRTNMDVGALMNKVTSHFRQTAEYKDAAQGTDSQNPDAPSQSYGPVVEELSNLAKRVTEKISTFNDIRESISQRILKASEKFKAPSDDPESSPTHKYILKGVISRPHAFYVLANAQEGDEDKNLLSPSVLGQQWWRLEYNSTSVTPVQATRVAEDEVLNAASMDAPKVVLVYASDNALNHENQPLPPQLKNFVRADNLAFQGELSTYHTQTASRHPLSSLSPSKRKAPMGSNDSDMEVEPDSSPRIPSREDLDSSDSSPLDMYPLGSDEDDYIGSSQPILPPKLRPLEPKPPAAGSSDDRIPVGLRQDDQEMQESGGGLLGSLTGKYKMGSYTPEINMDDEDEGYEEGDEADRKQKHN